MGAGRTRLGLLLAGLRWRAGSSAAMFVVALFAVGIGAFGPIYLHSAEQAIENGTLEAAPPGDSGLTLTAASGSRSTPALLARAAAAPRPGAGRSWFGHPLVTDDVGLDVEAGGQLYGASLVARSAVCRHVAVTGRCPRESGEVVLSTRTARELGLDAGQAVAVSVAGSTGTTVLRVVGLYTPGRVSDRYWWGVNYFPFGTGTPMKPLLDDLFTVPQTIAADAPASRIFRMVQRPFEGGSLGVDDVGALQASLARYRHDSLEAHGVQVGTRLPDLLAQAEHSSHVTSGIVAAVDVQLVLLSLFALYFVSSRTAVAREPDVRLAALRGFRPRSILAVAMAEPMALVGAAVPVGILGAWLLTLAGAGRLFGAGVGATVTPLAAGVAVATGLIGVGASTLGVARMLRAADTGAGLDVRAARERPSTWSVIGEVGAVAVAGAAFVELAVVGVSGGAGPEHTDPLAALAPGLLAIGLGILGARALALVLRATMRRTAYSGTPAWTLATRRIARRREFASQLVLLTLAVGLATFALSGWAVAGRNQDVRREFDVGAAKVLTVRARPGVNLLSTVRAADPAGRSAMAVVVEGATDGTTLAVDSTRMADVISWPPGLSRGGVARVARSLLPSGLARSVVVSGAAVRVTVHATVDAQPAPQLSAVLFDSSFETSTDVLLGTLAPGTADYGAPIAGLCSSGCRLTGLAVTWAPDTAAPELPTGTADLEISALSQLDSAGSWEPVAAHLDDPRRWTASSGAVRVSGSPSGLHALMTLDPFGVPLAVAPADVPRALPAVVTGGTVSSATGPGGALALIGLDAGTVPGRLVGNVAALPRVGGPAALVDLDMAERFLSGPITDATTEVWLSATAPPGIVARLASAGITVTSVDSTATRQRAARHSGVSLAYVHFLLAAVAGSVLAVAATAFSLAVGARRRQGELAALRAVGIRTGSLRRFLRADQVLTAGTGVLLGTVAGLTAAAVALGSVPELDVLEPGPPLQLGLPAELLALLLVALVVALVTTTVVAASIVARSASADKLGGAQT